MDLRSGRAFWPIRAGLLQSYPRLETSLECDVVVIGGGITGALVADRLTSAGAEVILIDKRDIGHGSTSASTALLQYEIDTHLSDLIESKGKLDAELAYRLCRDAIFRVEDLTRELGDSCGFARKPSLYYASCADDIGRLELEFTVRKEAGFQVELLHAEQVQERFGFAAPAAILSAEGGQVDPFQLTHRLLARATKAGAQVYDRTEVESVTPSDREVRIKTTNGYELKAKKIVCATGYESQQYLKSKVVDLKSSFALVSEPLPTFDGWQERALVWESARPYFYLRTTDDDRALMGGGDLPFNSVSARDALLGKKTNALTEQFARLFPQIPLQVAYSWAGTFGETQDGLAYIGETPEFPGAYFALGYGGNGITYSVIAADIITDLYFGRTNDTQHLFRFGR